MKRFEKSTRPRRRASGGIRTSLTNEVTMLPKAAPMMTPIARSTTLPRRANSRNSFHIAALLCWTAGKNAFESGDRIARAALRRGGRGDAPIELCHALIDLARTRPLAEEAGDLVHLGNPAIGLAVHVGNRAPQIGETHAPADPQLPPEPACAT